MFMETFKYFSGKQVGVPRFLPFPIRTWQIWAEIRALEDCPRTKSIHFRGICREMLFETLFESFSKVISHKLLLLSKDV